MAERRIILLIEDDELDVLLTTRALLIAGVENPVQVASDGSQGIAYLKGSGKYAKRSEFPLPVLVLLDLKMPKTDGFEVLRWIRQQPGLRSLHVVVLSSSLDPRDSKSAYELGADSFLGKPTDFGESIRLMRMVGARCLARVAPSSPPSPLN